MPFVPRIPGIRLPRIERHRRCLDVRNSHSRTREIRKIIVHDAQDLNIDIDPFVIGAVRILGAVRHAG